MWPFSTDLFSSALGIFGEIFGPSGIEITELEKKTKQTNKTKLFGWILGHKVRQGCVYFSYDFACFVVHLIQSSLKVNKNVL